MFQYVYIDHVLQIRGHTIFLAANLHFGSIFFFLTKTKEHLHRQKAIIRCSRFCFLPLLAERFFHQARISYVSTSTLLRTDSSFSCYTYKKLELINSLRSLAGSYLHPLYYIHIYYVSKYIFSYIPDKNRLY